MNPLDIICTRLYNQKYEQDANLSKRSASTSSSPPLANLTTTSHQALKRSGSLYNGIWDCFSKTVAHEGFLGLYKGLTANWLRIGPHTVLTFVFLEQLRKLDT